MGRFDNKKDIQAKDIIKQARTSHSYEHLEIISTRNAAGERKQYAIIDLPSFRSYVADVERLLDIVDSLMDKHGPKVKSADS